MTVEGVGGELRNRLQLLLEEMGPAWTSSIRDAAEMASEPSGLDEWVLTFSMTSASGDTILARVEPHHQAQHRTLGLLEQARDQLR